jgi:hypothetical protein
MKIMPIQKSQDRGKKLSDIQLTVDKIDEISMLAKWSYNISFGHIELQTSSCDKIMTCGSDA